MPIDGRAQRKGAADSASALARRVSRAGAARLLRVRAGLHGRLRTEELPDRTVAEPDRKGLWLQQLHSRQLPCENQLRYQRRAHRQTGIRRARDGDRDARDAQLRGTPAQPLARPFDGVALGDCARSEEHTSELQSLMRISYAVLCLKKKNS